MIMKRILSFWFLILSQVMFISGVHGDATGDIDGLLDRMEGIYESRSVSGLGEILSEQFVGIYESRGREQKAFVIDREGMIRMVGEALNKGYAPSSRKFTQREIYPQGGNIAIMRSMVRVQWGTGQSEENRRILFALKEEGGWKLVFSYPLFLKSHVMATKVVSSSQAETLGIRAGDVILSYDGRGMETFAQLIQATRESSVRGDAAPIPVEVERNGQRMTFQAKPGRLGIQVQSRLLPDEGATLISGDEMHPLMESMKRLCEARRDENLEAAMREYSPNGFFLLYPSPRPGDVQIVGKKNALALLPAIWKAEAQFVDHSTIRYKSGSAIIRGHVAISSCGYTYRTTDGRESYMTEIQIWVLEEGNWRFVAKISLTPGTDIGLDIPGEPAKQEKYDLRDFFPVRMGDEWTYQAIQSGRTTEETRRFSKVEKRGESLHWELASGDAISAGSLSGKGLMVERIADATFPPPALFLKAEMMPGDIATSNIRMNAPHGELNIILYSKLDGLQDVFTPAGTFKDCVQYSIYMSPSEKVEGIGNLRLRAWLARDVGPVKITNYDQTGKVSRDLLLLKANVGGRSISSRAGSKATENLNGIFGGIGITFQKVPQGLIIHEVMPGTPAEKAGLKKGEIITAADGRDLAPVKNEEASRILRGPVGSTVNLTLLEPDSHLRRGVSLIRDNIVISHVKSDFPEPGIGAIRITYFNRQTPLKVKETLDAFHTGVIRGIILDLRKNKGGLYSSVKETAGMFVGREPVLWQFQKPGELTPQSVRAEQNRITDAPLAVLVGPETQSGGELLATALKTSGRAILFGSRTMGKGISFQMNKEPDGSMKRVVGGYLLTADGRKFEGAGIRPDVEIPPDESEKKALDHLKSQGSGGFQKQKAEKGRNFDTPRRILAFYYPWYGNPSVKGGSGRWFHWKGVNPLEMDIACSTNYPKLGAYDSHDPKLIEKHTTLAKMAGIDGLISSWWGRGTFEDQAVKPLLEGCRKAGMTLTVYYEKLPEPATVETASGDLLDILNRYGNHPAWLKVEGRPVIFIYSRAVNKLGLRGWANVIQSVNRGYEGGAIFIGDRIGAGAARVFDGIHTYITAGSLQGKDAAEVRKWCKQTFPQWVETAESLGRISTVTVIPGYDDTKNRTPGLKVNRMNGEIYRAQWEEAMGAGPDWILITSWNEWHEGSEIEPSLEHGEKYLDITAEYAGRF